MIYEFIEQHRPIYSVEKMCQVWRISRSGYYAWRTREPGTRGLEEEMLKQKIQEAYRKGRGVYGSPRITKELNAQGIRCGKNRIARVMQKIGLKAKSVRRWKQTTDSRHSQSIAPHRLKALKTITRPNQAWVSDITYIWTQEGWFYLAAVLDLYSRKIVGWCMQERLTQDLVTNSFQQAVFQRNPGQGLIFHSDRGSQYASQSMRTLLQTRQAVQSMTGRGNCYDNAVMESFFHSLKTEWVRFQIYATRSEAKQSLFDYIEIFYNRVRRHSSIDYYSPNEFENLIPVS
jgi:putative transposase